MGVNLTFDMCTPPHETADLTAERLAKAGINAVRLHHCDSYFGWPETPVLIDYAYGALQDMDGIFFFAWSEHIDNMRDETASMYSEIVDDSTVLVNLAVAARLFRTAHVQAAQNVWTVAMDAQTELETIVDYGYGWNPASIKERGFPTAAH